MTGQISFSQVQAYLDAIAKKANNEVDDSPHERFWNVDYTSFVDGNVPGVRCDGNAVPIIDKAKPINSAFYVILTDPAGWCRKRQMPGGGPFITDAGYKVTLADGTTVTGQQIKDDLAAWLSGGYPK